MIQITTVFKSKVVNALLELRADYNGSDSEFAKEWNIAPSVYKKLTTPDYEGILKDTQWLSLGRELDVSLTESKWKTAKTDVYITISEDINFCKKYAKSKICVDDCGIGKSYSARHISKSIKNCFYVDASQSKTKQSFIRLIAKTLGIDPNGKYIEVKANIKYYIKMLPEPIIIIDEAGDLEYPAFLELKELWNTTEGACGWYMIGADGLREKIERGIRSKKVGYRELFSRYSERYTTIVPLDRSERTAFYRKLITDVLSVNMLDRSKLSEIVKRCLTEDPNGNIGGLRRAESLLILYS